jgi:hypothetical protein
MTVLWPKPEYHKIERKHILIATELFEKEGMPNGFAESTKFDVIINDRKYPPKAIIYNANLEIGGESNIKFAGGINSSAVKVFKRLGFDVVDKLGNSIFKKMKKLGYTEFENLVFDWLNGKHKIDSKFTFSVRQKGSKGAESDYFIGTKKSGYFGTTFWNIPVSFPGSSSDLINLMFDFSEDKPRYYWQFTQPKKVEGKQNQLALQLIQNIAPQLAIEGRDIYQSKEDKKTFSFYFSSPIRGYENLTSFFDDLLSDIDLITPTVDEEINKLKAIDPEFIAERISLEFFQKMLTKMEERFNRYATNTNLIEGIDHVKGEKLEYPLNQILYGPPGTGKTYSTIIKALSIIENRTEEVLENEDREELKNRFDEFVKSDQIVFSTFHQSMSYEDFVEGIKPLKPKSDDPFLKYDIEDGIFKTISNRAKSKQLDNQLNYNGKINFEDAFKQFKEDWEMDSDMKFSLRTPGYEYSIVGFTDTSIQFKKASGGTGHTLSKNTLRSIYYGGDFNLERGIGIYYPAIIEKLESYSSQSNDSETKQNFVIIIDEINRGNVSQIFGELITLIEENKRTGFEKIEALEIKLPYSKEQFSVPDNLYIIGTMNTADRSVEALDSALRRRFSFQEMMPKPKLLSPQQMIVNLWNHPDYFEVKWDNAEFRAKADKLYDFLGIDKSIEEKFKDDKFINDELWSADMIDNLPQVKVDLKSILKTINERIEVLIDRDHTIGHSYFMGLELKENIEDALKLVFKDKIIPLLQEYFFNDYGKIQLVLGEGFVKKIDHGKELFHKAENNNIEIEEYLEKPSYSFTIDDKDFKLEIALNILLNGKEKSNE